MLFKWAKGPAVAAADFGNPIDHRPRLCVYDKTSSGHYDLVLGGSPSINGGGTWKSSGTGWKFSSKTGGSDGIVSALLTREPSIQWPYDGRKRLK